MFPFYVTQGTGLSLLKEYKYRFIARVRIIGAINSGKNSLLSGYLKYVEGKKLNMNLIFDQILSLNHSNWTLEEKSQDCDVAAIDI